MTKVLVVGLGIIGRPMAEYLGDFFNVYGYDLNFIEGSKFTSVQSIDEVRVHVIVVCVPTSQVPKVCKMLTPLQDRLVLIESTMQIGTCRKIAEGLQIRLLAYCPHRYWRGDPKAHGVRQLRVLSALNKESLEQAKRFYAKAEIPIHSVSSLEVAEASKLVENANRFVNIAFAEETKMLCDELGLNFNEVRAASNSKWNVNLLEARDGIHGVCLPQDIGFLIKLHKEEGVMKGAVRADHKYRGGER